MQEYLDKIESINDRFDKIKEYIIEELKIPMLVYLSKANDELIGLQIKVLYETASKEEIESSIELLERFITNISELFIQLKNIEDNINPDSFVFKFFSEFSAKVIHTEFEKMNDDEKKEEVTNIVNSLLVNLSAGERAEFILQFFSTMISSDGLVMLTDVMGSVVGVELEKELETLKKKYDETLNSIPNFSDKLKYVKEIVSKGNNEDNQSLRPMMFIMQAMLMKNSGLSDEELDDQLSNALAQIALSNRQECFEMTGEVLQLDLPRDDYSLNKMVDSFETMINNYSGLKKH